MIVSDNRQRNRDNHIYTLKAVAERSWASAERARDEAALRESEARYRTLFNSIEQGFMLVEALLDANGKISKFRYLKTNPSPAAAQWPGARLRQIVQRVGAGL